MKFDEHIRPQELQDNSLVMKNDLLIKRIAPNYVNVVNDNLGNTYATSNIIILRPSEKIDTQYLAYVLEMQGLVRLNHFTKKGVTIRSVSKKELGEISIPILPIERQIKYGELRSLNNRKQELLQELLNEEKKVYKAIFQKIKAEV